MGRKPLLVDHRGNPLERAKLTQEISAPTLTGVRSPRSGYPGDGLNPQRLAAILREANAGHPVRYMELAEIVEERDPHYQGILGTRKRSVSQIDITVKEGARGSQLDLDIAKRVRNWLERDELQQELFDILDAIGKGYSFTEIVWDYSERQYQPLRLEYRDPRWFRFDQNDLKTPLMLADNGQELPLPAYKFIHANFKAKSGLPLRSGLARPATWNWLFKAYTQRDWAIFTQTYGQPLRVGKYGPGASEDDKNKLFRAVANIAGDCAAIIPESMMIDFVEAQNISGSTKHYEERCDWLDRQMSKAVLGQTATTDAVTGGLGSGAEHREVQEDIERADAVQLQAILNRDLIRPFVDLEFGPQASYPTLRIARPEVEDLKAFSEAIGPMIDRGARVKEEEVLGKFGLSAPKDNERILTPRGQKEDLGPDVSGEGGGERAQSAVKYPFNGQVGKSGTVTPETQSSASGGVSGAPDIREALTGQMQDEAAGGVQDLVSQIEAMVNAASSLEELHEMIEAGFGDLDEASIRNVVAAGLIAATAGGRLELADETGLLDG